MLVTHQQLHTLGIGCIAKITKTQVQVNFGLKDVLKVSVSKLEKILREVDVSKTKTVPFSEFRRRIMMPKDLENFNDCIVGNEVKHFVGIGWTTQRVVTHEDLQKLKRVI